MFMLYTILFESSLITYLFILFFLYVCDGDRRDLHVLTHSFPTRRASDLPMPAVPIRHCDGPRTRCDEARHAKHRDPHPPPHHRVPRPREGDGTDRRCALPATPHRTWRRGARRRATSGLLVPSRPMPE